MSASSVSTTITVFGGAARRSALVVALALAGACAAPGSTPEAEQTPVEIARAESAVKLALIEAADVDAASVSVTASDDTVTLGGFVASESEREAALREARAVAGQRNVVDEIEVRD